MKVRIDNFALAGEPCDPVKSQVSSFSIDTENTVELVRFIRSETIRTFDRKNRATTITFQVTRIHPDTRDAQLFMLEHGNNVPRQGLVTFTAKSSNGQEANRFMQAVSIQTFKASFIGVTTLHSYQMIGGEILTTRPLYHA